MKSKMVVILVTLFGGTGAFGAESVPANSFQPMQRSILKKDRVPAREAKNVQFRSATPPELKHQPRTVETLKKERIRAFNSLKGKARLGDLNAERLKRANSASGVEAASLPAYFDFKSSQPEQLSSEADEERRAKLAATSDVREFDSAGDTDQPPLLSLEDHRAFIHNLLRERQKLQAEQARAQIIVDIMAIAASDAQLIKNNRDAWERYSNTVQQFARTHAREMRMIVQFMVTALLEEELLTDVSLATSGFEEQLDVLRKEGAFHYEIFPDLLQQFLDKYEYNLPQPALLPDLTASE